MQIKDDPERDASKKMKLRDYLVYLDVFKGDLTGESLKID